MTTYKAGDILLVRYPFASGNRRVLRPALVVLDTSDADVLLAKITTQSHPSHYEVSIGDWRGAGLIAPSFIRLHKMAALEKQLVDRVLGHLQTQDRNQIALSLRTMFTNW